MPTPTELRQQLIAEHGRKCPVCGKEDVDLVICHLTPLAKGGKDIVENLGVMCCQCHFEFDRTRPTELEFTAFLADLLARHPDFSDIRIDPVIARQPTLLRVDIVALDENKRILIECKSASFFTRRFVGEAILQVQVYRKAAPEFSEYIIAFPGRATTEQASLLRDANIPLWDVDFILGKFAEQIVGSQHQYFRRLFQSLATPPLRSSSLQLLDRLKAIPSGRSHWSEYQKTVGVIYKELFCPPLDEPLSEFADEFNVNRRDWIFPNHADQGFWRFMREAYSADYIVIDAKNYVAPISKSNVLQIANYLKPHGAGMFAIIASREGASTSARATVREQWMSYRKLILVTDDQNMEEMLLSASSKGEPSRVIGQIIQDFRLSM